MDGKEGLIERMIDREGVWLADCDDEEGDSAGFFTYVSLNFSNITIYR